MLSRLLAGLDVPFLAIPGNHDEPRPFGAHFAEQPGCHHGADRLCVVVTGPLRVRSVGRHATGLHHGAVSTEAAAWLDGVLASEPARPTIVMMHQPPFRDRHSQYVSL